MNINNIDYVDVCCGLAWGDEAKGKIVANLAKTGKYNYVCRWSGGNNAGHTIYVNDTKYKTHLIPSGIFYNIKSIIGPDCVVNINAFFEEIDYLNQAGFNTKLIKISPKAHIIYSKHIEIDKTKLNNKQGTTSKGIAPCYSDKYMRIGTQAKDEKVLKPYIWNEVLTGKILCEGAQGFWLDINQGNYPYVTSSSTLPYAACSLGFPPKLIRKIYGAIKIYDTRSGIDPVFPEELLNNEHLLELINKGTEFGTTTGRMRKVNWLNLDKVILAINISGTTDLIISKMDVIKETKVFKLYHDNVLKEFSNLNRLISYIENTIYKFCKSTIETITFSDNPYNINNMKNICTASNINSYNLFKYILPRLSYNRI
jgi:adenylosuccinate synthase